jgi:hypothetical protein
MWGAIRAADWPRAKNWNTVMRKATQFTLRIHDRPGLLADIASALWDKSASIQAFSADVEGRKGILHLVVDKVPVARKALDEIGLKAREEEVIVLTLPNKPGSLALVAAKLVKSKVKILYGYTGPGDKRGETNTYLGVSDVRKALKILRHKMLKPIAQSATHHNARVA